MIICAGCNGAGKSRLSSSVLSKTGLPVIDADAIARRHGLSAMAAGRRALAEFDACRRRKQSFIVETTLSGRTLLGKLRDARAEGYLLTLHYIGLAHPDLAKARVRQRVALGEHDVPPADIERRFFRSLDNLPDLMRLVDETWLYDNSDVEMRIIVRLERSGKLWVAEKISSQQCWWARRALADAGFRLPDEMGEQGAESPDFGV